jgi:cyclopropane fatty-acyl-phospholipid synthase-like methyltransferase
VHSKPFAPSSSRNAKSIAGVLSHEFRDCRSVLEIGSGTGQHAVEFAQKFDHLTWQTSDLEPSHVGILQWIRESGVKNVRGPLVLDVLTDTVDAGAYDAVYSANTSHIMSYTAACRMFDLVGKALMEDGVFCLYGPFKREGEFSTPSNAEFDASLRERNAAMGIRDLADLDTRAGENGMTMTRLYAMPANNLVVVWQKKGEPVGNDYT